MSNYCKKMCVLKQLSSGFASDGKKVSGLLTAEKYGTRLTACFSLINFAPLSEGRYVGALCDTRGGLEFFELSATGGTLKRESNLSLEDGFCCLICHVAFRAAPAAFGKSGEDVYDVKKLCAAIEEKERGKAKPPAAEEKEEEPPASAPEPASPPAPYDDEIVATENYYEFPDANVENLTITEEPHEEQSGNGADDAAADAVDTGEERAEETACGTDADADEDAVRLFKVESGNEDAGTRYYDSVKGELDELFEKYPSEDNLQRAVEDSRWVKIEFAPQKYYTVGLMFENGKPRYICYGVPAENKNAPPAALKGYCSYLPLSLFDLRGKGYWMMYQDADTGRCVEISAT